MAQTPKYVVVNKAACMPSSCWGHYRKIAVLEMAPDWDGVDEPRMISDRARGVRRVVHVWDRCHHGTTERCASWRAETAADDLASHLSAGRDLDDWDGPWWI